MEVYEPSYSPITKEVALAKGTPRKDVQIGNCIYCGSSSDLTDEHSIPRALWGENKLASASCKSCATKTSIVELRVLRDGLGPLRQAMSAPTRHSRKSGRWTGKRVFRNDAGHEILAPAFVSPHYLLLPQYSFLPRGLTGAVRMPRHRKAGISFTVFGDQQDPKFSGYWSDEMRVDLSAWARFLVKVAYCEYIRLVDQKYRFKEITNFITGGVGDCSKFVGGREKAPIVRAVYFIKFAFARKAALRHPTYAILAYIRLFAFRETPSYLIWLGDIEGKENLPVGPHIIETWNRDTIWPIYPPQEQQ